MPKAYKQFMGITAKLEKHYKDMQDVEFTIERGKLWMLQTSRIVAMSFCEPRS